MMAGGAVETEGRGLEVGVVENEEGGGVLDSAAVREGRTK